MAWFCLGFPNIKIKLTKLSSSLNHSLGKITNALKLSFIWKQNRPKSPIYLINQSLNFPTIKRLVFFFFFLIAQVHTFQNKDCVLDY